MPTKRPDELPEGNNFSLEDIILVEKSPDSNAKQLLKSTIRDFMSSATQFDPENVGQNSIVGFQSKFEWMVAQMEKLQNNPAAGITPYEDFQSASKDQEIAAVTPSVTPSVTPTVTPSMTPNLPPPPTPSPSASPFPTETEITIKGSTLRSPQIQLSNEYLPKNRGYSTWSIKNNSNFNPSSIGYLDAEFFGLFPYSWESSHFGERLYQLYKVNGEDIIYIDTSNVSTIDLFGIPSIQRTTNGGLLEGSSITITIQYS
tara:strand:- start:117 stop:890 length:774 start_codon:yes stop_codon:yes gene_type:complete